MSTDKEGRWSGYGFRIFLSTISHPFEYAKVLIQIGYEPCPPKPSTTFFGKPALTLPNIFQYVKHIYTVDGIMGCYRGLTPKLCGTLVSAVVTQKVINYLDLEREQPDDEEETDVDENRNEKFVKCVKGDILTHSVAIITSNSFNVITIRMMGEFIGRETKYSGIFASIRAIYEENGLLGFLAGLVPRLLGDILTVCLASTLTYVINKYLIQEKELRNYTSAAMYLLSSSIMYPFQVVSNCMAVNNSGLKAGSPPYMPIYRSWLDCWSDLSDKNQLKRGSSLLVRYYIPGKNKLSLSGGKVVY